MRSPMHGSDPKCSQAGLPPNPGSKARYLLCVENVRAYIWPILLAMAIFVVSGAQNLAAPDLGFQFSKDKLAHFLVFGLLATAILRTPVLKNLRPRSLIIAALLTSGYGGFDEIRQSFTPGRSVEFADWLADTIGAIVAVLVYAKWQVYRKLLEWHPRKKKR